MLPERPGRCCGVRTDDTLNRTFKTTSSAFDVVRYELLGLARRVVRIVRVDELPFPGNQSGPPDHRRRSLVSRCVSAYLSTGRPGASR
jgi:hypothetical protein